MEGEGADAGVRFDPSVPDMIRDPHPFLDVRGLVYAPRWHRQRLDTPIRNRTDKFLFLVPSVQAHTLNAVQSCGMSGELLGLGAPGTRERVEALLRTSPQTRLVFVTQARWRDGVDDEAICGFLSLVQLLAARPSVCLDVITVRSIACEAYSAASHPLDAVYVGMSQSLAKEFPNWEVYCSVLDRLDPAHLRCALEGRIQARAGAPIVIREGFGWTQALEPVELAPVERGAAFRTRGTYVIIGGAGGIGRVLAEYLATRYQARLILVGRRSPGEVPHELRERVTRARGSVVYECVDVSDRHQLREMLSRYPEINGVIHSALVLKDSALVTMTRESLLSVLAPKVHGAFNLAEALRGRTLDFALFFSSVQSHLGSPGQANYAGACACKDAIASLMGDALGIETRIINWGYWGSIGIVATEVHRMRMQRMGVGSIEAGEGLQIIERFLATSLRQISVLKASREALETLGVGQRGMAGASASVTAMNSATVLPASETLRHIVGTWDPAQDDVAYNNALASALEAYSRCRAQSLRLPAASSPKLQKLARAIASIPRVSSAPREEVLTRFPALEGHFRLLDACIDTLPRIFAGELDPLEVLFPGGSFDRVEPVYRDNPIADYFNKTVGQIVRRLLDLRSGRRIRILEVGAGTGSTTQFVLPMIQHADVEYVFTDVSAAFLVKARARFARFGFVKYGILDLERTAPDDERFDVVIATNVIHATADVRAVVSNLRRRLHDDGVFILNEVTALTDFATLTFGLTDGWWLSSDGLRIPNSPLIAGPTWHALLREAGFGLRASHGDERQQVIVALCGEASSQTVSETAVMHWLKGLIADVMHMAAAQIDVDAPFRDYGIDSLISQTLLAPIREVLGYLPATILFEYSTVRALAGHLRAEHTATLEKHLGTERSEKIEITAEPVAEPVPEPVPQQIEADSIADLLRRTISQVMCLDLAAVEDTIPFRDFGIDSIISLELLKPLRERFGYLPATLLFEYPSVRQLSEHLRTLQPANKSEPLGPGQVSQDSVADESSQPAIAQSWKCEGHEIAVIGVAGRFPMANDCEQLWAHLAQGQDCTGPVPPDRWSMQVAARSAAVAGGIYANVGGFINHVDAFDRRFFNITPRDAEQMDPQERLMLEVGYHAVLQAGYCAKQLHGSHTGVFVGVMNCGYSEYLPRDPTEGKPTVAFWSIANRLSYFFDWHGPSMAIDTACSSSLTALHLACQALRAGECDAALVGGVNVIANARQYEHLCRVGMLSRSNRCKPFGAGADGFVDGEGVCAVILKRYQDAMNDGDRILGVIRASGVNAGGRANGYSAPNAAAQAALIGRVLRASGLEPREVSYVETHGTGTELGDPLEIKALSEVFSGAPRGSVRIGSIKGNIGHLESAAGLAGLIKVLLQFEHGALAPSLHADPENPHLALRDGPFQVNKTLTAWKPPSARHASISSFGAGGANAHVVLSEPLEAPATPGETAIGDYPIVLSSTTTLGLLRQIEHLRGWLENHAPHIAELSYMLCCCRDHFPHRVGFVVSGVAQLKEALERHSIGPMVEERGLSDVTRLIADCSSGANRAAALTALVRHYVQGADVPWTSVCGRRSVVSAPDYLFSGERHWIESADSEERRHRLIVAEHEIKGRRIAPAAFVLSEIYAQRPYDVLEDVFWQDPITDLAAASVDIRKDDFIITARSDGRVLCKGNFGLRRDIGRPPGMPERSLVARHIGHQEIYRRFADSGYVYGDRYRALLWAKVTQESVFSLLSPIDPWGYSLSLSLLDGGLQSALLLPGLSVGPGVGPVTVPFHAGSVDITRLPIDEPVYCWCVATESGSKAIRCNFTFMDAQGQHLIRIQNMVSVGASVAQPLPAVPQTSPAPRRRRGAIRTHELA